MYISVRSKPNISYAVFELINFNKRNCLDMLKAKNKDLILKMDNKGVTNLAENFNNNERGKPVEIGHHFSD